MEENLSVISANLERGSKYAIRESVRAGRVLKILGSQVGGLQPDVVFTQENLADKYMTDFLKSEAGSKLDAHVNFGELSILINTRKFKIEPWSGEGLPYHLNKSSGQTNISYECYQAVLAKITSRTTYKSILLASFHSKAKTLKTGMTGELDANSECSVEETKSKFIENFLTYVTEIKEKMGAEYILIGGFKVWLDVLKMRVY